MTDLDLSIFAHEPIIKMLRDDSVVHDRDAARLNNLMDAALVEAHRRGQEINDAFRSSWVATEPCGRAMVFSFLTPGISKTKPRDAAVLDDGTWRHKRIQYWFRHVLQPAGILKVLAIEEALYLPHYLLSGHVDVVAQMVHPALKHLGHTLFEVKGKRQELFEPLTTPDADHVLQGQLYLHFKGFKYGFIVYENKNGQERKLFKIAYQSALVRPVLKRLLALTPYVRKAKTHKQALRPGDLPPQEIAAWCNSCPWRVPCFALAKKGV